MASAYPILPRRIPRVRLSEAGFNLDRFEHIVTLCGPGSFGSLGRNTSQIRVLFETGILF